MAEVVQLVEETAGKKEDGAEDEESIPSAPPRTIWSGSLRIGLVNIPVKAVSIDRKSVV